MKYANRRTSFRAAGGQFRKAQAADVGIGGVCPTCGHLLIRVYDGDLVGAFVDPSKFRNRCFTCEPQAETSEPVQQQPGILAAILAMEAEREKCGGDGH